MAGDAKTLKIDEVKHVAQLAKLSLSEQEIVKFQGQLSDILEYVKQLQEVDTAGVEETSQVTGLENVLREDSANLPAQPGQNLSQEEALSNAKSKYKGYVKVPGILEAA